MTEPTKHRHAKPKRAARPERRSTRSSGSRASGTRTSSRFGWFATTPGMVVLAVVVLGLAFVIRLIATSGDDSDAATADKTAPGAKNASYGNQWTSADGSKYEISVATLNDLVAVGSPSTCVAAPIAGQSTNLHFTVTIKNRSKKEAPVPEVLFGTNLTPAGAVTKKLPSFARSNKDLEVVPLALAKTCADGAKLEPSHRAKIPAGGSVVFTGTFGPAKLPVPRGVAVLIRYFEKDGSKQKPADLLATFGAFPTG